MVRNDGEPEMYRIKPYYSVGSNEIPVSDGMYKITPYYEYLQNGLASPFDEAAAAVVITKTNRSVSGNSTDDSGYDEQACLALEKRQEALSEKLRGLRNKLDAFVGEQSATGGKPDKTGVDSNKSGSPSPRKARKPVRLTRDVLPYLSGLKLNFDILRGGSSGSSASTPNVDLLLRASAKSPPLASIFLLDLLRKLAANTRESVSIASYRHSSTNSEFDHELISSMLAVKPANASLGADAHFTILWTEEKQHLTPAIEIGGPSKRLICGDGAVIRLLASLVGLYSCEAKKRPDKTTSRCDYFLDLAAEFARGNKQSKATVLKQLNGHLGKSDWLMGTEAGCSLADLAVWASFKAHEQELHGINAYTPNVKKWFNSLNETNLASIAEALTA